MQTNALEMQLRAMARERIHRLELPCVAPRLLWAGRGNGAVCSLCGSAVSSTEIEHEIEQELNGGRQVFHFHVSCQAAWRLETER